MWNIFNRNDELIAVTDDLYEAYTIANAEDGRIELRGDLYEH